MFFDRNKDRGSPGSAPRPPRLHRHGSDTLLESIILVGFIGLVFFLLFKRIPHANKEAFAQGQGALIVVATLVAKSLWERRGNEGADAEASAIRAETTRDLAAKLPPAGTTDSIAAAPTPPPPPASADDLPDYAR